MKNSALIFGGFGLGAGLMYLLDPDRGKRRRALIRDRALHTSKIANREVNKKVSDLRNRAYGFAKETENLFRAKEVSDEQLAGQIRSKLGRLTSHPHAVKTNVENGKVTLSGLILADEVCHLVCGISSIPGVVEIENKLDARQSAEHISSLQGLNKPAAARNAHPSMPPVARVLAAVAGGGLAYYAVKRRDALGPLAGSVGLGLLTSSVANLPLRGAVSTAVNGPIQVHKSIKLNASPERVFETFKHPEFFPDFMSHVREVKRVGEKRFHWTVDGIARFPVEWETEITEVIPNRLIRWRIPSETASDQSGVLRLEPMNGVTNVHIDLNYRPIAGSFGHFIAGLFNRDPKSEMDDDLLRMKAFIEKGKLPRDAAARRRKNMKIKEIMTKDPACCLPQTNLQEVAHLMIQKDCGAIPIVEDLKTMKPVGIITDRDIACNTVGVGKNPLETMAAEIMTFPPISVKPDTTLDECVHKMEDAQIRRMLVVNDKGACCGIVAQADIAMAAPMMETAELVKDVSLAHAA